MKKKFIAVYALIGVLALGSTTLTSCVDDNESASVTAVRDAKAAQLNALAALSNAQAASEELRAQAEADLKAAEAAYRQALADQEASKADFLAQQYADSLEVIKARYEASIQQAKADAAEAQGDLWEELDNNYFELYNDYRWALSNVQSLNEDLFEKQYELANAEVSHEAAVAAVEKDIYEKNLKIATKTAQIERLQTQVGDKDALLQQMNDLAAQAYQLINTDKPAAQEARDVAQEAYDAAFSPINYRNTLSGAFADEHERLEWEATALDYIWAVDTLKQIEQKYSSTITNKIIKKSSEVVENAVEGCAISGKVDTWIPNPVASEYLAATQAAVNALNLAITTAQTDLGASTDAASADGTSGSAYAIQKYWASKSTTDAAAAAADPTNATKQQMAQESAVKLAEANEGLAAATETLAEAQQMLTSYNNAIAAVTEGSDEQKAYADAVAKAVEAKKALQAAKHEIHLIDASIETIGIQSFTANGKVDETSVVADSEYDIAKDLYDGTTTVEQAILNLENQIAKLQKQITEAYANSGHWEDTEVQYYADTDGDGTVELVTETLRAWVVDYAQLTIDQIKQMIQMEIDQINAELEAEQAHAEQCKAALEAAIENMTAEGVEVPSTPETPSTDTETPAEGEEAPAA